MKRIIALAISIIIVVISALFCFADTVVSDDEELFSGMQPTEYESITEKNDTFENAAADNDINADEEQTEEPDDNNEDSYIPKEKLPTSAGIEALRNEFKFYEGISLLGIRANDYALYTPTGTNDTNKYPLVIYIHGAFHGWFKNTQLDDSDFPYWVSEELQSRFDAGGAFIMMPRSTGAFTFWDRGQISSVKAAIDFVIENNKDNIDTSKIIIMGSSDGGAMVRKMLCAYPDFFNGALTLCTMGFCNAVQAQKFANVPYWLIANKKDFFVWYPVFQVPMWNTIRSQSNVREKCRFTSLDTMYYPDGSKPTNTHNLARVVSYDLQMLDGSDYPYLTTVDGNGNTIYIYAGNGVIAWINEL